MRKEDGKYNTAQNSGVERSREEFISSSTFFTPALRTNKRTCTENKIERKEKRIKKREGLCGVKLIKPDYLEGRKNFNTLWRFVFLLCNVLHL